MEFDIIRRSRALEGEERSALSYARAISAIKGLHMPRRLENSLLTSSRSAFPRKITSRQQVEDIPHLGTKILTLVGHILYRFLWSVVITLISCQIEEYLDTGHLSEACEFELLFSRMLSCSLPP